MNIIEKHISAQGDQGHGQQLFYGQLNTQKRLHQEHCSDEHQGYAPGKRVSVKTSSDNVILCIERESDPHQLRGAASIDSGKKPGAEHSQDKEMSSMRDHGHLEKTGEDGEVYYGL